MGNLPGAVSKSPSTRFVAKEAPSRLSLPVAGVAFALALTGCATSATGQNQSCVPTEADGMGPFYVAGTPLVDDLNRHGAPGEPLLLSGRILSAAEGTPPIADARIEIWQTDGEGDYHPAANGDYDDHLDADVDLRGTVVSGDDGTYAVRTVVPGAYVPRPRHFHYRITAPGHAGFVTQLYVTGDGVLRQPGGDCRHAPLEPTADGWRYQAPDIFLIAE
jgi:protocatechuate 3,4-dioxygenase beta subunit